MRKGVCKCEQAAPADGACTPQSNWLDAKVGQQDPRDHLAVHGL